MKADKVPNGEGLVEGPGAEGDRQPNGPLLPSPPPQTKEPSPGVPAFRDSLEKSEGAIAEGSVHKGDALLSLRISIPMQETELCKHTVMSAESPPTHVQPPSTQPAFQQ